MGQGSTSSGGFLCQLTSVYPTHRKVVGLGDHTTLTEHRVRLGWGGSSEPMQVRCRGELVDSYPCV